MRMCVSALALLLALVSVVSSIPRSVQATTVVFQDSDFPNANWSTTVEVLNGGGSVSAVRVASGGVTGAYRRVSNTLNSAIGTGFSNSVYGFHSLAGATFDPAVGGPIVSINYTESSQRISGGVQACGVALRQGGVIYYGPGFLNPTTFGVWAATVQTGLVASQFDALAPGVQNPNFSAPGTIEFGFSRANSTSVGGAGGTTIGGIDNWQVTLTVEPPVPTAHSTWGGIKALYRGE